MFKNRADSPEVKRNLISGITNLQSFPKYICDLLGFTENLDLN